MRCLISPYKTNIGGILSLILGDFVLYIFKGSDFLYLSYIIDATGILLREPASKIGLYRMHLVASANNCDPQSNQIC